MKKKIISGFFVALGLIYIKSAFSALFFLDESRDYELLFGWKSPRPIFIFVKSVIGLGLVTFNLKDILRSEISKKDIIFLAVCLFFFGFLNNYDHIKELIYKNIIP